tara:strand:- start:43 stop:618 length:576 start_codon:yes stop_codon:yes gene_type:complete
MLSNIILNGQTQKVEVTVKEDKGLQYNLNRAESARKSDEAQARNKNEGIKAKAAELTAKAAAAAAMSEANVEIKIPISVDLSNYTHIAIITANTGPYVSFIEYNDIAKTLRDGPFTVLNPFVVDRKKFRNDKRFLRETKNPNWLYLYYNKSTQGLDAIRRVIIKDSQNKTLYNVIATNTDFYQIIEPILFF